MTRQQAVLIAILSSVLSSLCWIFQDRAVDSLGPMAVVSAQGILVGLLYLFHSRSRAKRISAALLREHWRELVEYTLLRGLLGGALVCYALMLSGSIKVMFFTKLEPYFVLFWAWLLEGQRINRSHALLLAVHVFGAILLSTGGKISLEQSQLGDLMLIVAVGIFSYTYLHAGRLSKELGPMHVNGLSSLLTGLASLPIALIISPPGIWTIHAPGWIDIAILVIVFNVVSMTMWFAALRYLEGWLVSALRAVGPVVAAPIAYLFFGQALTEIQIFGAGLVLLTSGMLARRKPTSAANEQL